MKARSVLPNNVTFSPRDPNHLDSARRYPFHPLETLNPSFIAFDSTRLENTIINAIP